MAEPSSGTVLSLSRWRYDDQASVIFQETADYAKDPTGYMISKLGQETFDARKQLLSLPEPPTANISGLRTHRIHFAAHISSLLGKEHATFFITGVMAQNAALRTWCDRKQNRRVAWHGTSHLEIIERQGFQELWAMERMIVGKDPRKMATLDDYREVIGLPEDKRPAVILMEIPVRELGLQTFSWEDLVTISKICREAGVALHMDGARLWDIEPWYQETAGKSMRDIAALFDSIYLSLYKGIGGTTGCILITPDKEFLMSTEIWKVRAGGDMFSSLYNTVECERAFNENIGTFAAKTRLARKLAEETMKATEQYKADGKPIITFFPEPITASHFQIHYNGFSRDEMMAARGRVEERLKIGGFESLRSWGQLQKILLGEIKLDFLSNKRPQEDKSERHFFGEMVIDNMNLDIPVEKFVEGYVGICRELVGSK